MRLKLIEVCVTERKGKIDIHRDKEREQERQTRVHPIRTSFPMQPLGSILVRTEHTPSHNLPNLSLSLTFSFSLLGLGLVVSVYTHTYIYIQIHIYVYMYIYMGFRLVSVSESYILGKVEVPCACA